MKLATRTLRKPRQVKNVDGTPNKAGKVIEVAILEICQKNYRQKHEFFVAEVDCDKILLGYPFLEAVDPQINWRSGKLYGAVTLKGVHREDMLKISKTTVAQQLAEAATNKKE
jgi:hypothetical protein